MYSLNIFEAFRLVGFDWFSIQFRIVYELDHKNFKNPILYVIPVESILGTLPVVPVGDTGTSPHRLRNHNSGAPGDSRPDFGDGCRMWFVNSWALGWSSDMLWSGAGSSSVCCAT